MAVPRQSTWSEYISSIVNLTLDKCYIFDIEINQKSVKKTKTESAKLICINFIFYSELKWNINDSYLHRLQKNLKQKPTGEIHAPVKFAPMCHLLAHQVPQMLYEHFATIKGVLLFCSSRRNGVRLNKRLQSEALKGFGWDCKFVVPLLQRFHKEENVLSKCSIKVALNLVEGDRKGTLFSPWSINFVIIVLTV